MGIRVPAGSLLLSPHSLAWVQDFMSYSNNNELSVYILCFFRKIETMSFSYEVFNAFIVYLYTDEIHIKLEHVEGEMFWFRFGN